jgi:hypothetical protein
MDSAILGYTWTDLDGQVLQAMIRSLFLLEHRMPFIKISGEVDIQRTL